MHPRGHELVHIRSMNWVQSTFITCHAFLFFARTSLHILGHMTVSSTTLHFLSSHSIALEDKVTRWLRQTGQCVRQKKPPQVNKEAVVVDRIPGLFGFPMYQEMLAVCVFAVLVIVAALAVMLHLAGQLSTAENIPGELLMGGIHTSFPR